MPPITISTVLQVIVALGLLNVWLLRSKMTTAYRGGNAKSLKEEFATYGLPEWVFYGVGFLKVGSAILLLVGLWIPEVVFPAALAIAGLMIGALVMHVRVKDPMMRSLPAFLMLLMSVTIAFLV